MELLLYVCDRFFFLIVLKNASRMFICAALLFCFFFFSPFWEYSLLLFFFFVVVVQCCCVFSTLFVCSGVFFFLYFSQCLFPFLDFSFLSHHRNTQSSFSPLFPLPFFFFYSKKKVDFIVYSSRLRCHAGVVSSLRWTCCRFIYAGRRTSLGQLRQTGTS